MKATLEALDKWELLYREKSLEVAVFDPTFMSFDASPLRIHLSGVSA